MTNGFLRRQRGFSLIELMVSVVIGMLALAFALRLVAGAEKSRDTELGGSDSMQNGMVALFSISGDASDAGFGLNDPIVAGCDTVFSDTGGFALMQASVGGVAGRPLAPVVIESNSDGSDRVTFYTGSALGGTGTLRLTNNYVSGNRIDVDRIPYGFARRDVIVVAPEKPGAKCALAQIDSDPDALPPPPSPQFVTVSQAAGYRFNTGNLGVPFTGGAARLFNLGQPESLSFHTWSVAGGFLNLRSTDLAGGADGATVTDNIVAIKAQYGFDLRTGNSFDPQKGVVVSRWSSTLIDADGNGTVGNGGDYQHVVAVRLAVVARSKAVERAATCTATPSKPQVFTTQAPQGVAAVPVTVNVAVPGDANDWRCYRYRTFETVVNLRNTGWRPEAWKRE
jgi:type IV pilus assembly protein PilW